MTVFAKLALGDLQEQVGGELLGELEELLPLISPELNLDNLYSSKKLLEKILISFGGIDRLANTDFRAHLLDRLSPKEIDELTSELGLPSSSDFKTKVDSIVRLGWRNPEVTETVLGALGFDPELAPRPKAHTPALTSLPAAAKPYRQLKDYQFELLCEASKRLRVPFSRFVVQMPTGAGKTRTAIELVCGELNEQEQTVIWLAHSEELCDQAVQTFLDVWEHVGRVPVDLVRLYGSTDAAFNWSSNHVFMVASFQRLYSLLQNNTLTKLASKSPSIGLVIVDEAHKVIAPTYKRVTKALLGDSTRCIGLTATPGRSAINLDENKELADFFFEKIVTFDSRGQAPIQYLRDKGILAEAKYEPLVTSLNFDLSERERKYLEDFFDFPPGLLKRMGANSTRNAEIVKRIQTETEKDSAILFFGCNVTHSKFICSTLNFLGITAAHVDGTTPRERRSHLIESYRRGDVQVLCNFGVLATGFDAPRTDVVFISRPTASVVLYSQMIGRGLRGPAVGGTERCKIIDVKDNIAGFSDQNSVYSYFSDYWLN